MRKKRSRAEKEKSRKGGHRRRGNMKGNGEEKKQRKGRGTKVEYKREEPP